MPCQDLAALISHYVIIIPFSNATLLSKENWFQPLGANIVKHRAHTRAHSNIWSHSFGLMLTCCISFPGNAPVLPTHKSTLKGMFSSFVFGSHDHLLSIFNPSERYLDANHMYLIKSCFNLLIASCSWWYPTPLFALFLSSSSLLQIFLNLFNILQPFKSWSPHKWEERLLLSCPSKPATPHPLSLPQACFGLLNCCVIAAGAASCCLCTKHQVSTRDLFHMNSWSTP